MRNCGACGAKPGELHQRGCGSERCPMCGGQAIGCGCIYGYCGIDREEMEDKHPEIYHNGPTEEMYAKWDTAWDRRRMPWTGEWGGAEECRQYGFWCRWIEGIGWRRCQADDPGATEDVSRLAWSCEWSHEEQRWLRRSLIEDESNG